MIFMFTLYYFKVLFYFSAAHPQRTQKQTQLNYRNRAVGRLVVNLPSFGFFRYRQGCGNLIVASWNCLMCGRLVFAAATSSTRMI